MKRISNNIFLMAALALLAASCDKDGDMLTVVGTEDVTLSGNGGDIVLNYNQVDDNIAIHHITPDDTRDAPTFDEVWEQFEPLVRDLPFVAHNAAFDRSCLIAAHRAYDLYYPDYPFYCTMRASQRKLRGLLPNHRLPTVAAYCGFDLNLHHNALADAEACAHIALQLL